VEFCPTGLDPVVVDSLLVLLGLWSVVLFSFCVLCDFMVGRIFPDVPKGVVVSSIVSTV
jgi:hypothetical protein